MEETDRPVVDRAVSEAYMAMYYIVPESHWVETEVIRRIFIGSSRGRILPEPILRLAAPVIAAKISQLAMREGLMKLAGEDLRRAIEAQR